MKYRGENAARHSGRPRIWHRLESRLGGERHAIVGVKAVVAASFERIHRSNLVGMGVLPLQFMEGTNAQSLGLDGSEVFNVTGLSDSIQPGQTLTLEINRANGETRAGAGEIAHRYADRGRLLSPRRDPAVCPARASRTPTELKRACFRTSRRSARLRLIKAETGAPKGVQRSRP